MRLVHSTNQTIKLLKLYNFSFHIDIMFNITIFNMIVPPEDITYSITMCSKDEHI